VKLAQVVAHGDAATLGAGVFARVFVWAAVFWLVENMCARPLRFCGCGWFGSCDDRGLNQKSPRLDSVRRRAPVCFGYPWFFGFAERLRYVSICICMVDAVGVGFKREIGPGGTGSQFCCWCCDYCGAQALKPPETSRSYLACT